MELVYRCGQESGGGVVRMWIDMLVLGTHVRIDVDVSVGVGYSGCTTFSFKTNRLLPQVNLCDCPHSHTRGRQAEDLTARKVRRGPQKQLKNMRWHFTYNFSIWGWWCAAQEMCCEVNVLYLRCACIFSFPISCSLSYLRGL